MVDLKGIGNAVGIGIRKADLKGMDCTLGRITRKADLKSVEETLSNKKGRFERYEWHRG